MRTLLTRIWRRSSITRMMTWYDHGWSCLNNPAGHVTSIDERQMQCKKSRLSRCCGKDGRIVQKIIVFKIFCVWRCLWFPRKRPTPPVSNELAGLLLVRGFVQAHYLTILQISFGKTIESGTLRFCQSIKQILHAVSILDVCQANHVFLGLCERCFVFGKIPRCTHAWRLSKSSGKPRVSIGS